MSGGKDEMLDMDAVSRAADSLFRIVVEQELFETTLPQLSTLVANERKLWVLGGGGGGGGGKDARRVQSSGSKALAASLLSRTRAAFGRFCLSKMRYHEAIAAFLSASPPLAEEAVRAARQLGDWQLLLTLASKFASIIGPELAPMRLAQEIVSGFRESLAQGETERQGFEFRDSSFGGGGDSSNSVSPSGTEPDSGARSDKASQAAQMCLDYCDDVEGAVSILVHSRRWLEAAFMALKRKRTDLLHEEVSEIILSVFRVCALI